MINNTTIVPYRQHISSTYGEQQRQRVTRAAEERNKAGIIWRGTPSDTFDWDRAFEGLYRVFDQVYGPQWRNKLRKEA